MKPLLILLLLTAWCSAQSSAKKLIEFGWDEPDTAYMRQHIAAMEQTPFDGCVYHIKYDKPDGSKGDFLWECWGSKRFEEKDVASALADLKATSFSTFTRNFLRFNVCPGDVDWFDDFSAILANATLAASLAKEGKSAGLLFDIEQYNSHLFEYSKQKQAKDKSFDEYAKQCRLRGRQVMAAFQKGYPDLTIFLTFGYSLPHAQAGADKTKLAAAEYGLLAPFLDGLFDAGMGTKTIVDGYEISYGYRTDEEFDDAAETMREKLLPLVGDPGIYRRRVSIGFGLWMDYDWRKKGWDAGDVSKNYFTPKQFEKSLTKALATADEYVWIYTESPKWWDGPDAKPTKLPPAYMDAVRNAVKK
jgi:hypothetical protein